MLNLEVITPSGSVLSAQVEQVTAPVQRGRILKFFLLTSLRSSSSVEVSLATPLKVRAKLFISAVVLPEVSHGTENPEMVVY